MQLATGQPWSLFDALTLKWRLRGINMANTHVPAADAQQISAIRTILMPRLAAIKEQLAIEANWRDRWQGPLHAAEVASLTFEFQWVDSLLNTLLYNYENAVDQWAVNDPEYKRLHMHQPPKPALPASLAAFLPKSDA
jgi:hypothetical protein